MSAYNLRDRERKGYGEFEDDSSLVDEVMETTSDVEETTSTMTAPPPQATETTEGASEEDAEASVTDSGDVAVSYEAITEKEFRISALAAQVEEKRKARRFEELEEKERLLEEELLTLSIKPRESPGKKGLPATVSRSPADAASAKKVNSNVTLEDLRRIKELTSKAGTRVEELTGGLQHSTDSSEDEEREGSSKLRRRHRRELRSGKKLHLSSRVVFQAKWPQAYISRTASGMVEPKYEQLTMGEFCAGYAKIMGLPSLDPVEREARIHHLQQLMHLACYYEWAAVLCLYAACLAGIESGELTWNQSFSHLESISLRNRLLNSPSASKSVVKSDALGRIVYCADYNAGSCSHSDDHLGEYPASSGKPVLLSHVCAPCLRKGRKLARHKKGEAGCAYSA